MAGNENSGGDRPTAPQNNPANVNLLGGNGQSGNNTQAAKYIPGLPYGQGQATMQQQMAAPMAGSPTPEAAPLPELTQLNAPSQLPNTPVQDGAALGPGRGLEALNLPNPIESQYKDARTTIETLAAASDASPMMKYLAQRVGQKL